jgi:hypothetical protein
MAERTTVRLPDDLIRRAKRKAAAEGRTLTSLIEDGLRRVLNERAAAGKAGRILPPVSKATGGLMPGIDLNDTAALQEMEDLEYAERLR